MRRHCGRRDIGWDMKLRFGAALLVGLGACGVIVACVGDGRVQVTADPDGGALGDGSSDGPSADAPPVPEGGCDREKGFGEPTFVAGYVNTSAHEALPRLTADELTMVFERRDADGATPRIMQATRTSRFAPFGEPRELQIADAAGRAEPAITPDGLTLYFVSSPGGNGTFDVFRASRKQLTQDFAGLEQVQSVSSPAHDSQPFVTADEKQLWFASNRLGDGGDSEIHRAYLKEADAAAAVVEELRSPAGDHVPVLSHDGRTIFFASFRQDAGAANIWMATRASPAGAFGEPREVPGLSSPTIDAPGTLSQDGCRLYLSSRRAAGNADIYMAERLR